jgi:putative ABC transport system substrate-binding protein
LGLLHELVPRAAEVAVLINPSQPAANDQANEVMEASRALAVKVHIFKASSDSNIDEAFGKMTQMQIGALLVAADSTFHGRRARLVALASKYAIPAMYELRDFAVIGGLASYGTNLTDGYHQAGLYVGRILEGARPADLPAVQTTKFEFVINLRTARALSIEVPPMLSAHADDVIE